MSISLSNRVSKRISWIFWVLAIQTVSLAHAATGSGIELVAISKISTYELWSTLSPQQAKHGPVVAAYWPFDPESGLYAGKKKICGVLLLGSPDGGSQPTSFEVRSDRCGYILGGLKSNSAFFLRDIKGNQEIIKINSDGKIYLLGKMLGQIKF